MELYKTGSDRNRAEIIIGPVLGTMVGVWAGFHTNAKIGLIVGVAVAALMTLLTLLSWTKPDRRRDKDSGGGDGGSYEGGPIFDGSSKRHFDANHHDSDSGWGDGVMAAGVTAEAAATDRRQSASA